MYRCLVFLFFFVSGCSAVGPDYIKPEMDLPQEWSNRTDRAQYPDSTDIQKWWTVFRDPTLNILIDKATDQNLDLRLAIARVEEARASLQMAAGDYLPSLDADGSVTRQGNRSTPFSPDGSTDTLYGAGMDTAWELDLFGRIRRSVQASSAEYQASQEDRTDVMISMYAQVASTYINIRTLQARLETTQKNIQSQKEILGLTKSRYKHGLATGLDVAQAEMVLANTQAEIPPLRIDLEHLMNAVDVLLGSHPGRMKHFLTKPDSIPLPPVEIGTGVPADLLRQRPDIRRAERELAAQTARIGMAEAELYPALALSGSLSYTAANLDDMFTSASRSFLFGPTLRWNIFNAGKTRAMIRREEARAQQALVAYELTVLNALSEVADAMTGYREQKIRLRALQDAVQASRDSLHMAQRLYKDGLADFQNVLDAQRSVYAAEDQLDQARGNAALYMVSLYKALGGGWDPERPGSAAHARADGVGNGSGSNARQGE